MAQRGVPWWWVSRIWDGAQCLRGGQVGYQSKIMVYVRISTCSGVLPDQRKLEMAIVSEDARES